MKKQISKKKIINVLKNIYLLDWMMCINNINCELLKYNRLFPLQIKDLYKYTKKKINILNIGFYAGHKSIIFLSSNKHSNVVSFDHGTNIIAEIGNKFIENTFPDRHILIRGEYQKLIEYHKKNKKIYDVIYIDSSPDSKNFNEFDTELLMIKNMGVHNSNTQIIINTDYQNKSQLLHITRTLTYRDDYNMTIGWL